MGKVFERAASNIGAKPQEVLYAMRLRALLSVLGMTAAVVVPVIAAAATCPSDAPAPLTFEPARYIDTQRAGGEPVSVVAQDGAILVSAHAGTTHVYKDPSAAAGAGDFAVGYTNQTLTWRSTDNGSTWSYVGIAGAPAGPHTPTSTGFSDPDFSMDRSGRIYNTEIDLANVSVFSSVDDGQSFPFGNPAAFTGDRPWLTGQEKDEVFLLVNALVSRVLLRSTDGGNTFVIQNDDVPADGKIQNDPLNPDHGLIAPYGRDIAISSDDGKTWEIISGPDLGASTQFFSTLGVDTDGGIYMAAAGGYRSPFDREPSGEVTFGYFDRATETWGAPVTIPTPRGDALWPWIVAGDDGRVAVIWYQSIAANPQEFYVYAAYTTNGHGSTVQCSDGTFRQVPPAFSVTNASSRPVHRGQICLSGTACNLQANQDAADRRLGDFMTVNFHLNGTIFITSGDTMLPSPTGGPKPVSNPIFLRQSGGAKLLEQPIVPRKTRCLFPLPVC